MPAEAPSAFHSETGVPCACAQWITCTGWPRRASSLANYGQRRPLMPKKGGKAWQIKRMGSPGCICRKAMQTNCPVLLSHCLGRIQPPASSCDDAWCRNERSGAAAVQRRQACVHIRTNGPMAIGPGAPYWRCLFSTTAVGRAPVPAGGFIEPGSIPFPIRVDQWFKSVCACAAMRMDKPDGRAVIARTSPIA